MGCCSAPAKLQARNTSFSPRGAFVMTELPKYILVTEAEPNRVLVGINNGINSAIMLIVSKAQLNVRVPATLKLAVERHAKAREQSVNAAANELLDAGLLANDQDALLLNIKGVRAALLSIGHSVATRGGMIGANMHAQFRAAGGEDADFPYILIGGMVVVHAAPAFVDGTAVGSDSHVPLLETYISGLNNVVTPKETYIGGQKAGAPNEAKGATA